MHALALDRRAYFRRKRVGYLAPFAVMAIAAASFALWRGAGGPAWLLWLTPLAIFVVVPLLDAWVGADAVNPTDDEARGLAADPFYRGVTLAAVPIQLALVGLGAWAFATVEMSLAERIGWIVSVGTATGGVGITFAHELIHKQRRVDQLAGGVLLALACYPGFKIEHVRGHHVHVGTPLDNTTARLGQNVYAYLCAAFTMNLPKAWAFEAARLRAAGLPAWHWRNEVLAWHALMLAIALALHALWGAAALGFFAAQALFGVALLETVNYIEHYGLARERRPDGTYAPVGPDHSWNSNARLTNLLLINLQRHADHHRHARRPYAILRDLPQAPQLPAGYPTMILAALVPPVWFRIMNPRVAARRARAPAASV
jgi:alkane 1-monooxygenase